MTDRFALDTSALVAWLEDEQGADRIDELLRNGDEVLLPWPTLMELYYLTVRRRGVSMAQKRYAMITHLPVTILDDWGEALWLQAARLKSRYRISLADAQIAALARANDAVLVHKDPEYVPLAQELKLEALPLKPKQQV